MLLLMGGTSESGEIMRALCLPKSGQPPYSVLLSTATQEPLSVPAEVWSSGRAQRISGRLDRAALVKLIRQRDINLAICAVHPYAAEARKALTAAARECGIPSLVYLRPSITTTTRDATNPTGRTLESTPNEPGNMTKTPSAGVSVEAQIATVFADIAIKTGTTTETGKKVEVLRADTHTQAATMAVQIARKRNGSILLTTGSRHLTEYAQAAAVAGVRIYARVLDCPESREALAAANIPAGRGIYGRGPFPVDANLRQIVACKAAVLVSKESGEAGGVEQKLEAARQAGCAVIMVRRPEYGGLAYTNIPDLVSAVRAALPIAPAPRA